MAVRGHCPRSCHSWLLSLVLLSTFILSISRAAFRDRCQRSGLHANFTPDNDNFNVTKHRSFRGDFPWIQPQGVEFFILKPSQGCSKPYYYFMDTKYGSFIRLVVTHILMISSSSYVNILDYCTKPSMTYISVTWADFEGGQMVRPVYQSYSNQLVLSHHYMGMKGAYLRVVFWFTNELEENWKPRPWVLCPALNYSINGGFLSLNMPGDLALLGYNNSLELNPIVLDCTWHIKKIHGPVSYYVRVNPIVVVEEADTIHNRHRIQIRYLYMNIQHAELPAHKCVSSCSCHGSEHSILNGHPSVGKTYILSAGRGVFLRMILNVGRIYETLLYNQSFIVSFVYGAALINENITADPQCEKAKFSGANGKPAYSCIEGRHSEPSYQWCIPYENHCDGIKNCPSGSDENCSDGTSNFSKGALGLTIVLLVIFLFSFPVVLLCLKRAKWKCLPTGRQDTRSEVPRQPVGLGRSHIPSTETSRQGNIGIIPVPPTTRIYRNCRDIHRECHPICPLILQQGHFMPPHRLLSSSSAEDPPPSYSEALQLPRVEQSQEEESESAAEQADGLPSYDAVAHIQNVPGRILQPKTCTKMT